MTGLKALPRERAVVGTYVIEQFSRGEFQLLHAGAQEGSGSTGAPEKHDTQLRSGGRKHAKRDDRCVAGADFTKRTRLTQLEDIDMLLAKSTTTGFMHKTQRGSETHGGSQTAREKTEAAVHLPPVGMVEGPSDTAFGRWLKLPDVVSKNVKHSKQDEKLCPGNAWSLLLLRATFDDPKVTAEGVGDLLNEVLGLSLQDGAACAEAAAKGRPVTYLKQYSDHKEAFEKASNLQTLGLAVQVVSERQGGEPTRRRRLVRSTSKNYEDLFDLMRSRTQDASRKTVTVLPPIAESFEVRQRKCFREAEGCVDICVVPKDPVKELLFEEDASASDAQWRRAKLAKKKMDYLKLKRRERENATPTAQKEETPQPHHLAHRLGLNHWDNVVGEVQGASAKKLTTLRKEVCLTMRFFIFGVECLKQFKTFKQREAMIFERIGTRDQVQTLFNLWQKMDADGSGRVNLQEFRDFSADHVAKMVKDQLESTEKIKSKYVPEWARIRSPQDATKFSNKLNKALEQALLRLKSSFVIEDLMRFVWPGATKADLIEMRRWCSYMSKSAGRARVQPPPVMDKADLDGLKAVFTQMDADGSGDIEVHEMVATGLIHEDQAVKWMKMWDTRGEGSLNLWEFCEMMCPAGFRAYEEAATGSLPDGTLLVLHEVLQTWKHREEVADSDVEDDEDGEDAHLV